MPASPLEQLKDRVREICRPYRDREHRVRRLFIQERAASFHHERHREFVIKSEISRRLAISYSSIHFCGSAQLGFSIHKDQLFQPGQSDLDVACVDMNLYQDAWKDIIENSRGFSDSTSFSPQPPEQIEVFKDQILRRGMIRVAAMPRSDLKSAWIGLERDLSRNHAELFRSISIAIYMNEYAFCWKQDSSLRQIVR